MVRSLKSALICGLGIIAATGTFAAETISYSGSSTIGMSILKAGAAADFEKRTGIKFSSIETPGSGKGVQALQEGKVPLAGASRALTAEEKKAGIVETIIGYDAVVVFVNRMNSVRSLKREQLKGIFTGKITNWKEVGGANAAIRPNTEIAGEKRATMLVFQELAMDNAAYGSGFKEIDLPRDQIKEVANDPNAICTVSLGLVSAVDPALRGKVKAILVDMVSPTPDNIMKGNYPIFRPLVLATRGAPEGTAKKFIDFMLSAEGQSIVRQNYFIPVR